jgi:hypothetical protein
MKIIDKLGKSLQGATQSVVKGTKDFTDTARLNSLIADENKAIEGMYIQIGKIYHETQGGDENSPSGKLCLSIDAANKRIIKYEQDIMHIKGIKKCPECGTKSPKTTIYCGSCGVQITEPETVSLPVEEISNIRICASCHAELQHDMAFCTACGRKV